MIDCNITENFLRERNRMSKECTIHCIDCPLSKPYNGENLTCLELEYKKPDKAIAIVQKWSDENPQSPQKTFFDDFKEKYPNALLERNGTPRSCPYILGYVIDTECPIGADGFKIGCVECWNRPYEGEEGQK